MQFYKGVSTNSFPKTLLAILLIVSFSCFAKNDNAFSKRKKQFKDLAKIRGYNSAKEGFVIVTTNDLTHRLKNLQKYISHKSQRRGFRMYVATEDDFGKGVGRPKAYKIRKFLQKADKSLKLRYCLFIGNSIPNEGEIPMMKVGALKVQENPRPEHAPRQSCESKNGVYIDDGDCPTDYFYVDLSGNWDKDGDGVMAGSGDFGPGGITGQDDLWVGRIPYYGEASDYGKAQDVDIILDRSIRYDNEQDYTWRYGFIQLRQWDMIPNEVFFELDVLEPNGINYYRDKDYQDTIGFPGFDLNAHGMGFNTAKLMKLDLGYTRLGGHGHPTGMHGISSGEVRKYLNDKKPTVVNMGGCSVGMVESQHNLAFTLLRYHAIATHGGTRSVSGAGGNPSMPYNQRLLLEGNTVGQAWWGDYATKFKGRHIGLTAFLINVYGDPTSRPFPMGLNLPYPFVAKPVKPYHKVASSYSQIKKLPPHVLELTNKKKNSRKITIKTTEPWLVSSKKELVLKPSQQTKVKFYINASIAKNLSPGMHMAEIQLSSGKSYVCRRFVYLEVPNNRMVKQFDFEVKNNKFFDTIESSYAIGFPKGDAYANKTLPVTEGIVGKAADCSSISLTGEMLSPNQGSQTVGFWVKFNSTPNNTVVINQAPALKLIANATSIKIEASDFKFWGKIKGNDFSGSFPVTWETGKWIHLVMVTDQSNGVIEVYKDMKKVGELKTLPQMILAPKSFNLGQFNGAIDELAIYNKRISQSELKELYYNCYMESPSPIDRQRQVIPGDVKLSFASGKSLTGQRVFIYSNGNKKKKIEVKKNKKGEYIAERLLPDTNYSWYCVSYRKIGKVKKAFTGPTWVFKTSKNLIPEGYFESTPLKWSGQCDLVKDSNTSLEGEGSMRIQHGGSATIKATEVIKPNYGYSLKLKARTAWKRIIHCEMFYKDGLNDVVLTNQSLEIYQDRYGNNVEMDFFSFPDQPYIGKDLYVRIKSDKDQGSETWIDCVTLMPYRHKSTNRNPKFIRPINELRPEATVGNNLFVVRLNDWVYDPEGDSLSFEKISGPSWVRVRAGELMTNHGPKSSDAGTSKVVVVARDSQGGRIQFTVPIKVNLR